MQVGEGACMEEEKGEKKKSFVLDSGGRKRKGKKKKAFS